MTEPNDLYGRPRVRSEYEPEEFIEAFENAEDTMEQSDVREVLRALDSGRFHEMLDATHNVLSRSDLERRQHFVDNQSDYLLRWVKAFGTVEELNTFPKLGE